MNIFQKIFGNKKVIKIKSSTQNKQLIKEKTIAKRSIYEFFKLDFKNLPDDSFSIDEEKKPNGDIIKTYHKKLNYKECGIFDMIEIIHIGNTGRNIIFKSFHSDDVEMEDLKKLVDGLYLIYGVDSSGKGKLTNKDIAEFRDKEYGWYNGRYWSDSKKYKNHIKISKDEDGISMTIWGKIGM